VPPAVRRFPPAHRNFETVTLFSSHMRSLLAVLAVALVASPTASAAEPRAISQPRSEISDLFLAGPEIAWNWRDGDRRGSSFLGYDGQETTGPAGLVDTPFGQAVGYDGHAAAFSRGGTLRVERDGDTQVVARHRRGVSGERLSVYGERREVLAWIERGRRIYASTADTRAGGFTGPTLLARGRIRAMDAFQGTREAAVVWQDGRDRIRGRIWARRAPGFGKPFTIARAGGRVNDLQVTYNTRARGTVLWSTATGVRVAAKPGRGHDFARPRRFGGRPSNGIVTTTSALQAWASPGRIHLVYVCPDGINHEARGLTGTPHLDAVSYGRQVAYTLDGDVYFESELLGPGHDARTYTPDVVWIDDGRVMRATPDTPIAPSGELGPDFCPA
jgi:hypothetical protein